MRNSNRVNFLIFILAAALAAVFIGYQTWLTYFCIEEEICGGPTLLNHDLATILEGRTPGEVAPPTSRRNDLNIPFTPQAPFAE